MVSQNGMSRCRFVTWKLALYTPDTIQILVAEKFQQCCPADRVPVVEEKLVEVSAGTLVLLLGTEDLEEKRCCKAPGPVCTHPYHDSLGVLVDLSHHADLM